MRRILTSLSALLIAGCADDAPRPKSWSTTETMPEAADVTTTAPAEDVEIQGEFPETIDTRLRPLFPPHGVTTPDSTPTFRWVHSADALLVCLDRWCNESVRREQMRDGAGEFTLADPLPPGLYWWAVERGGERSFARSIVIAAGASDRPTTGHWGMRADFDGDGLADVAALPPGGAFIGVAYGDRTSLRTPRIWEDAVIDQDSWTGATVAPVDHNGTGLDWLAMGRPTLGTVTVSPDYVRGRFDVASYTGFGDVVESVGDVNGDGYGDIAVAAGGMDAIFVVFGGTEREDSPIQELYSRLRIGRAIAGPADFDEDGYSDFVTSTDDGVYFAYGGPEGVREFEFMPAHADSGPDFGASLAVGDVNADGRPDLIVGESGGCATVFYAEQDGFGSLRNCATGEAVDTAVRVALVDYDADGLDELVMVYEEPFSRCGLRSVVLLWQRIDGDGRRIFEEDFPGAQLVAPGDVDGDGVGDVVLVHQNSLTRLELNDL